MKKFNVHVSTNIIWGISLLFILSMTVGCQDEYLDEEPLSSLSADNTLVSQEGFEIYLNGLYWTSREEYSQNDNLYFITNFPGTDIGEDAGAEYFTYRNWVSYLTPINNEVTANWNWAYSKIIPQANTIIVYANSPENDDTWESEEERNAVIAQARFFRGYAYNFLANLYGGVPIVDTIMANPKFDYTRSSREEVYEFAKNDLEFAAEWLVSVDNVPQDGKLTSAVANHLLSEVYISLGNYDKAIESASKVIESGNYQLMTERFGNYQDEPGDVFSDLFRDGNYNRSSGNLESLFVWQFEQFTEGGGGSNNGNSSIRNLGPFLTKILSPDGFPNLPTDELGRGVGRARGTNYALYDIWDDDSDIRNSEFNFRRDFYYNNPSSSSFGALIPPITMAEDSLRNLYPYPRKIEGNPWNENNTSGRITNDVYVYRLAETYLLRAEAYLRNGNTQNAADDINTVRQRSNAIPISTGDISEDYILDERARELLFEEPRRKTLMRMGKLVDRVQTYGLLESSRTTVQEYHNLWPIPQTAIDANLGADLEQNPGY
ncbi:RagB/SusD family nutrient uptake outer membrane protein [Flavimarina sp. Hel_I_48]|uniref:RagB/SusD family nutrient uptake outer membrane protein n=1 Tax=Flavimarina sp. Hel_I_48 TaxID=1392488 RepID=UPI0004DF683C|nr:RagB/SusD family nutrient uptake outer membrane protein [Flavimarina sp. Hel_I_48]